MPPPPRSSRKTYSTLCARCSFIVLFFVRSLQSRAKRRGRRRRAAGAMCISAILIINRKGEIVISRFYRRVRKGIVLCCTQITDPTNRSCVCSLYNTLCCCCFIPSWSPCCRPRSSFGWLRLLPELCVAYWPGLEQTPSPRVGGMAATAASLLRCSKDKRPSHYK